MPKYHRENFQHATLNPVEVLAFRIANKFHEHHPHAAPPLKWCTVAALFAIHGDHREVHEVFPEWLAQSFLKRKDWTIAALDFSRRELDRLMQDKQGGPKISNHVFLAAGYASRDHEFAHVRACAQAVKEGTEPPTKEPLATDDIKAVAAHYGFKLSAYKSECAADEEADALKNGAKMFDRWHREFKAFRESEEGQFWGEV